MAHKIIITNPVEALISPALASLIRPCLSFKSVFYKPGIHFKKRVESQKCIMRKIKDGFSFPAGLVQRVVDYCQDQNIEVEVIDQSQEDLLIYEPALPGIKFRDDQLQLLDKWLDCLRGIIKSPTGSGKTVLGFGCISAFDEIKDLKILWMCHTKDLMKQAANDGKNFGFKDIGFVGDGHFDISKRITIATRQSFRKLADEYGSLFDVVVVDEVHHISSIDGEYGNILSKLLAPVRLGLTASDLKEGEPEFAAIGFIGPIVGELTIPEAIELGILATPKMKMLKTSMSYEVKALHKYSEVYEAGIVYRLERNQLIALTVKKHVDIGETVLIMVTQLDHGDNIKEALRVIGVESILVEGLTKSAERDKVKHALNEKHIHCVICSTVWKEGINIPSLNVVVNAAGGKDVLQALGRGLRKTAEKDTLIYYDIFDPSHRYLIEHFGIRLCFYMDNNWL